MITCDATVILKRELRKRIRSSLRALPAKQIEAESCYLTSKLQCHPAYKTAKSVGMYSSLPTEMDTSGVMRDALLSGKRVFLPRVVSKGQREMAMLEVKSMAEIESFQKGSYLIPEPPLDGRPRAPHDVRLDMILVPGLAFDMNGRRCGHGMGFYDVFLAQYAKHFGPPMPVLIALALSPQMVEIVPVTDDDWRVDTVIAAGNSSDTLNQL